MSRKEEVFIPALENKKIPILSLDNNWHRLFTQTEPNPEITALEEELNELLRQQGKNNTEYKEVKLLKKKLMDEIVDQMNELKSAPSKSTEKKLDENKRLIEECNEKLEECEDKTFEIPRKINEVNYKLMLATMEVCYAQIQENNEEIEEISKWVNEMRIELKKKVVTKQQKLKRNQNFYTYMHNIFGAEVIDIFDMKYNVEPPKTDSENPEKKDGNQ
jgi:C4-dicarboxylate-specific signal transduction histidine kinase